MAEDDTLLRTLLLVIAAILLIPFLLMVLIMPMFGLWGGGMMWGGTGATWLWFLFALIPLAIIIGLGYLVYRAASGSAAGETDPAMEELRMAYARGDLSDEEFEERRSRLRE